MKIGTIIILENLDLQRVISYIGGSLSDRYSSIELFIGNFILEDPNNVIGKCPKPIKIILDKYRSLILQNTSHEVALKELVTNWNQYFQYNLEDCNPYKGDFENMLKLVIEEKLMLDIFIGIYNGMKAKIATNKYPNSIRWKTKAVE